jgi:hypothetical protein
MSKRRSYFQRRARFLHGNRHYRAMAEDLAGVDSILFVGGEDDQEPLEKGSAEYVRYRDWLMANATAKGKGRKMHRALIRAEQRYNKLKRADRGTSRLRRDYPTKWR